jgi:hypothetical protein
MTDGIRLRKLRCDGLYMSNGTYVPADQYGSARFSIPYHICGSNHQQRWYRLGTFGSLAPPALKRLDIRRMCPRLAILGSAGIRRSDEWTAGEGRTVTESDLR